MMLSGQSYKSLCESNEAYRKSTMLEDSLKSIVYRQVFGVNPNTITHQEWVVTNSLGALNFIPMQKLCDNEGHLLVKLLIELTHITLRLNGNSGKIDRSKAQITSTIRNCFMRVSSIKTVNITHKHK